MWTGESWREIGVDRRILERDTCGQENLRESYVWAGNEGAIWVKSVGEEG